MLSNSQTAFIYTAFVSEHGPDIPEKVYISANKYSCIFMYTCVQYVYMCICIQYTMHNIYIYIYIYI